MRRSLICWLVAVPLALIGSQFAHALDYRLVAPSAGERAHLLAETGHSYLAYFPLVLALCTVVVVLGLVSEARRARSRVGSGLAAWHFGLFAPLLFSCQEHFERLAHDGSFPWDAVLQPLFIVGLALQLPFALLAFGLAWLLLRAARAVGRLFGRAFSARRALPLIFVPARSVDAPRFPALALGFGTRGPPLLR